MPFTLPDAFVEANPDLRLRDLCTIRDGITGKRSPINTDDKRRQQPISASATDEKVLAAIPPATACYIGAIHRTVGGKRSTLEASLRRLVEAGKVRRSGVARATVYGRVAE